MYELPEELDNISDFQALPPETLISGSGGVYWVLLGTSSLILLIPHKELQRVWYLTLLAS